MKTYDLKDAHRGRASFWHNVREVLRRWLDRERELMALRNAVGMMSEARESVDDALMIVESYGPWGADLNDAHRRQVVLADEVLKLQGEQSVLVRLLIEADKVLSTLEGESSDEQELLDSLRRRTWKNLPGARSVKLPDAVGIKHNALVDAFSQAQALIEIHKALFAAKKVKV